jgi:hypothetical protein
MAGSSILGAPLLPTGGAGVMSSGPSYSASSHAAGISW